MFRAHQPVLDTSSQYFNQQQAGPPQQSFRLYRNTPTQNAAPIPPHLRAGARTGLTSSDMQNPEIAGIPPMTNSPMTIDPSSGQSSVNSIPTGPAKVDSTSFNNFDWSDDDNDSIAAQLEALSPKSSLQTRAENIAIRMKNLEKTLKEGLDSNDSDPGCFSASSLEKPHDQSNNTMSAAQPPNQVQPPNYSNNASLASNLPAFQNSFQFSQMPPANQQKRPHIPSANCMTSQSQHSNGQAPPGQNQPCTNLQHPPGPTGQRIGNNLSQIQSSQLQNLSQSMKQNHNPLANPGSQPSPSFTPGKKLIVAVKPRGAPDRPSRPSHTPTTPVKQSRQEEHSQLYAKSWSHVASSYDQRQLKQSDPTITPPQAASSALNGPNPTRPSHKQNSHEHSYFSPHTPPYPSQSNYQGQSSQQNQVSCLWYLTI